MWLEVAFIVLGIVVFAQPRRGRPRALALSLLAATSILASLQRVEAFQLRGEVGSERSEERRKDKRGNPIRTCASDFDCEENETRMKCNAAMCKE